MSYTSHNHLDYKCGLYAVVENESRFLPHVDTSAHTTIIGTSSRTVLKQSFENSTKDNIDELRYIFPLYDGVSVVGFRCTVGDRVIDGEVQERVKAKALYDAAKARGQTAGLLRQSVSAADAFTITIGNVPAGQKVFVDITYLGELKHDAQVDGIRFTIPTRIVPRYGRRQFGDSAIDNVSKGNLTITVDVEMPKGSAITSIESPSHPIAVSVGHTSKAPNADQTFEKATASLSLATNTLDDDFILIVVATNLGEPTALLETHPTLPNHHALMATLVPKFSLPAQTPEIVFVCDRSGSMDYQIPSLISALKIFLKSLPVGIKFNICSFGTTFEFLWNKSKSYSQATLDEATNYVSNFSANMGGTEMYNPIEEVFKRRFSDVDLEVFVLTDGEIWGQDELFAMMNKHVEKAKGAIRVFSLGVGSGASTSLVNGIARSGGGFAQFVHDKEKMDKKVVRMLRASLFPHISDYRLHVKNLKCESCGDDFEVVEKPQSPKDEGDAKKPISLFQKDLKEDADSSTNAGASSLPDLQVPGFMQTPGVIPPLFPFSRTTVYVLLPHSCPHVTPKSVFLHATCSTGPLELEIPITVLDEKASTIHQLAARTEMKELEEGRGWVSTAKVDNKTIKDKFPSQYDDLVEREGVRIGTTYQVSGKWCSFVAVEKCKDGSAKISDAPPVFEEVIKVSREDRMPMMSACRGSAPVFRAKTSAQLSSNNYPNAAPSWASSGVPKQLPSYRRSSGRLDNQAMPGPLGSPGSLWASAMAPSLGMAPHQQPQQSAKTKVSSSGSSFELNGGHDGETDDFGVGATLNPLMEIIKLQLFEGNWRWTTALEKMTGIKAAAAKAAAPGHADDVLATACAVAYLKLKLGEDKEAWELIVEKAETWLEAQVKDLAALEKAVHALF
ncbi:hypothetical protein CcaverHIS002_0112960 [Cutaneotrichosporon cavernicola]|uniref:VIT-domain-containing protein n=1 Tax=Cutaneotrichosporon cavernicola TaxID=279322 RepID=A0AA48KXR6_9TREE|nr:uncharacterized protein CcaverHIS019_0112820 [Cutaneotrichosporon cavernicola]BEI80767.1 hypothetical protein CcaverHIS002_0112960 [Cutaneotrichosporon cavernicola]BEI88564.1 hypothetical protein CcaverHIS019_0112820 [Cutaneotrichosporon cavernicola]BEI96337.1 hypothetical protein CcaverHIS631_0112860 [Cutaneotrichosporon cavernicola]BEJ04109.1 hypothetical protein CcaverHIS641_0112840 [Cutaneotrichosporon cavernicola]